MDLAETLSYAYPQGLLTTIITLRGVDRFHRIIRAFCSG